jgi:hypothetical protein
MQAIDLVNAGLCFLDARTLSAELFHHSNRQVVYRQTQIPGIEFEKNARVEMSTNGRDPLELKVPLETGIGSL